MRALTIRQPWASLIACGAKTIETRSWSTAYRGPLLIHAGKHRPHNHEHRDVDSDLPPWIDLIPMGGCWEWWEHPDDPRHGGMYRWQGPLGAVVAVATLADVVPIVAAKGCRNGSPHVCCPSSYRDEMLAHSPLHEPWPDGETEHDVTDQMPLGDFTPGRYAWLLTDVHPIDPVPAKGRQGLWTPDDELTRSLPPVSRPERSPDQ